ncbi:MAG TPA: hypothetical protein VJ954_06360 [Ignavibacteriaceae bacterium]|nr:hypothetical protein [Ignavibacteriaceae bacterium]
MNLVMIFQVVLLVAASALCIGLIIYFNRITNSIKTIEKDFNQLTSDLKPLIKSSVSLSENVNEVTEKAKDQVEMSKNIVSEVKERVELLLGYEEKIREGVEGPVFGLIKNLSALANGVDKFWNTLKK